MNTTKGTVHKSAGTEKSLSIQLDITRHILDVCKRHELKIWADWGTLLGAVREHGIIPWDDDIDLMMMREDYEKLISLADIEFRHPFFLQSFHTEQKYYRGHAQVRYDGTAAILSSDVDLPFHQGIFVDIFVYDNIPDDLTSKSWRRAVRRARFAWKCLLTAQYGKGIKLTIAKAICGVIGYNSLYKYFEHQFTQFNSSETQRIACPSFDWRQVNRTARRRSCYNNTIMMPFEDTELPVPSGYDEVLTALYGSDYMTPRHDSSGHGEMIIDAEHDYREVLAELKKVDSK